MTGSLTDSQPASKLAHRLDAAPAIPTPDPHSAGEAPPTLPTPHATHAMQGAASGLAPRPPPPPTSPPPRTSVRPPPEPPAQGGHAGLSGPTEPVAARASQAQAASGERPHKGTTRTDDLANGRGMTRRRWRSAASMRSTHARPKLLEARRCCRRAMRRPTPQPPQPDAAPRSQPPAGDQVHPAQVRATDRYGQLACASAGRCAPATVRVAASNRTMARGRLQLARWPSLTRWLLPDALAATLAAPRSEGPETASQIWSPRTASLEPALKPALEPRAETSPSRHAGSTCEGESHTQTHSGSAPPLGVRDPGHGGSSGRTGVFNHGQALLVLIEYLKRLRRSKGAAAAGGAPGTDGNDDDDSGASRGRLVMGKLSPASLTSCSS